MILNADIDYLAKHNLITVTSNDDKDNELFVISVNNIVDLYDIWTDTLINLDGVIIDKSRKIIARSFKKMINLDSIIDEVTCDFVDDIYDFVDGETGIMYYLEGELKIATKYSFTSDTANVATKILNSKYEKFVKDTLLNKEYMTKSFIFQICIPETEIIGSNQKDDLKLLGVICTENGREMSNYHCTIGRLYKFNPTINGFGSNGLAKTLLKNKLQENLFKNNKGFVLVKYASNRRYFILNEEYKNALLLDSGYSILSLLNAVSKGGSFINFCKRLKYSKFLSKIIDDYRFIKDSFSKEKELAYDLYTKRLETVKNESKKDFYNWSQSQEIPDILSMLNNNVSEKIINKSIWKLNAKKIMSNLNS